MNTLKELLSFPIEFQGVSCRPKCILLATKALTGDCNDLCFKAVWIFKYDRFVTGLGRNLIKAAGQISNAAFNYFNGAKASNVSRLISDRARKITRRPDVLKNLKGAGKFSIYRIAATSELLEHFSHSIFLLEMVDGIKLIINGR